MRWAMSESAGRHHHYRKALVLIDTFIMSSSPQIPIVLAVEIGCRRQPRLAVGLENQDLATSPRVKQ